MSSSNLCKTDAGSGVCKSQGQVQLGVDLDGSGKFERTSTPLMIDIPETVPFYIRIREYFLR